MARPIRNIEIYLPLDYNDGRPIPSPPSERPIPESKYISTQQDLSRPDRGQDSGSSSFNLPTARTRFTW